MRRPTTHARHCDLPSCATRRARVDYGTVLDAQRTLLAAESAVDQVRLARFTAHVAVSRARWWLGRLDAILAHGTAAVHRLRLPAAAVTAVARMLISDLPDPHVEAALPARWDIFCAVIDNYGDIGVCWRLARQLVAEHGFVVRLWVDHPASFIRLCPQADPLADQQTICGVQVRHWQPTFDAGVEPVEVVVEAFACELPAKTWSLMAGRPRRPVWINLEYLSAEAWVEDRHLMASPHPPTAAGQTLSDFPGFTSRTGGLLRESDLFGGAMPSWPVRLPVTHSGDLSDSRRHRPTQCASRCLPIGMRMCEACFRPSSAAA